MLTAATLKAVITAQQNGGNDFAQGGVFTPTLEQIIHLTNGTDANQADMLFVDERTLGDGANEDLDLSAGGLLDTFGNAFTPAELTAIMVVNKPISGVNTTNLTIGGAAAPIPNISSGPLPPGGVFYTATGGAAGIATVTATTADELRIANSAGAGASYQIMLIGRSV